MSEPAEVAAVPPVRARLRPGPKPGTKRTHVPKTAADVRHAGVTASMSAERAAPIRDTSGEEPLTRKSRNERQVGSFDLPPHRRKRGWDYQWITVSVHGQPVEPAAIAEYFEGGWRPVPATEFPELLPPGTNTETIDRFGSRLFWRPIHLTQQAKAEDYEAAKQQERDRIQGALEGRPARVEGLRDVRGVVPVPLEMTIEGEAGAYDRSPLSRVG